MEKLYDDAFIFRRVGKYPLCIRNALDVFLEDSLNLIKSSNFEGNPLEFHFCRRNFDSNSDHEYGTEFYRKLVAHAITKFNFAKLTRMRDRSEIVHILSEIRNGIILPTGGHDDFEPWFRVAGVGYVEFRSSPLYPLRDKVIFTGEGNMNINPKDNLDFLTSYYRFLIN
ncbi:hypothetical protein J4217_04190 [Candidatus Pacearchaeota archaeon]|nr:hypothetical protein [Candidatus Pacearchaeota archaeon]